MLGLCRIEAINIANMLAWAFVLLTNRDYFDRHISHYHDMASLASERVWGVVMVLISTSIVVGTLRQWHDLHTLSLLLMGALWLGMGTMFFLDDLWLATGTSTVLAASTLYRFQEVARWRHEPT